MKQASSPICNLGGYHSDLGQFDKAIELLTVGLQTQRDIGNRDGEALTLSILGNIHLRPGLNDPQAALLFLQQADAIQDSIWDGIETDDQRVDFGDTIGLVARRLQAAHFRLQPPHEVQK